METSSAREETAMDIGVTSVRTKSKVALNRRPSGYWKVFSNWWRGRYAALKTRPTVNEVIEWYHRNAASSWPAGQVPCLKAVLRQSKGLRPIDGLKEYFREYRKKRKQQGGLALKAGENAAHRRARPAKRRRGRAAHKDSSDEDEDVEELEQEEASAYSDQRCSSDEEEDGELEDTPPPRGRRGGGAAAAAAACTAAADEAKAEDDAAQTAGDETVLAMEDAVAAREAAVDGSCRAIGSVQAVFDAWQHVTGVTGTGLAALDECMPPPPMAAAAILSSDLAAVMEAPDASYMPMSPHALATTTSTTAGDPVHPAVAPGMVPVAAAGSSRSGSLSQPLPPIYGSCPASDETAAAPYASFIQAVPAVRRPPSTGTAASRRSDAAASLPPLTAAPPPPTADGAAAAGDGASESKPLTDVCQTHIERPTAKHEARAQDDDHAGDRCSTGGGMPAACETRFTRPYMHECVYEGYGYEAYVPFGQPPPPPYACNPPYPHPQPHPCCYRSAPYHSVAYPYRAVSCASYPPAADCSAGGGATSSFSPMAPWPAAADAGPAVPQRRRSVESTAQLDACYPHLHPHPHPQRPAAWGPWAGAMDGGAPWHVGPSPPYGHDAAWGRGIGRGAPPPPMAACGYISAGPPPIGPCACNCGTCSAPSSCQQLQLSSHMGYPYGPYPGRSKMWAAAPSGGRELLQRGEGEAPVDGEACSSSVSEHDGAAEPNGRRSPCSGTTSRQQPARPCPSPPAGPPNPHWPRGHHAPPPHQLPVIPGLGHGHYCPSSYPPLHGCYPAPVYPPARGCMATAGSVTSLASLVAVPEESPLLSAVGTRKMTAAAAGGGVHAGRGAGLAGALRRGVAAAALESELQAATVDVAASGAAACDTDVSPYLADELATAAPSGSDTLAAEKDGCESSLPHGPGELELADCALGLSDGFGSVAREAMDHDLAFAFENFVGCDAAFDALACQ